MCGKIFTSNCHVQDHINEIHGKWEAIEDDIWAKIIVMERNRRVAKAYIRSPTITIGGGKEGFDGQRIGLEGFENPLRDEETTKIKKRIGNQVLAIRVFIQSSGRIYLVSFLGYTEIKVMRNKGKYLVTGKKR